MTKNFGISFASTILEARERQITRNIQSKLKVFSDERMDTFIYAPSEFC